MERRFTLLKNKKSLKQIFSDTKRPTKKCALRMQHHTPHELRILNVEQHKDCYHNSSLQRVLCYVRNSIRSGDWPQSAVHRFLKMNGVYHKMEAPYYPTVNGLAERFV